MEFNYRPLLSLSGFIVILSGIRYRHITRLKRLELDKKNKILILKEKEFKKKDNIKKWIYDEKLPNLVKLKLRLVFKNYFNTISTNYDNQIKLLVKRKKVFTPKNYDRYIFHLDLKSEEKLSYVPGDCLQIKARNSKMDVLKVINYLNLDSKEIILIKKSKNPLEEIFFTTFQLLRNYLDLFGKPNKKFYYKLAKYSTSKYEKLKLLHIGSDDNETFKVNQRNYKSYYDIIFQYKSLKLGIYDLIELIPEIKYRSYSIASSNRLDNYNVSILVTLVKFENKDGIMKYGQCSNYLSTLVENDFIYGKIKVTGMRLPTKSETPIIMAGLGTGMAPFRAFIQEKAYERQCDKRIGNLELFFGARYRNKEYLYREELIQFERNGLINQNLAFSRDQKEKIYIQHLMKKKKATIKKILNDQKGYFYLCGPTWPVPEIKKVLEYCDIDIEELKKDGRYILEVY